MAKKVIAIKHPLKLVVTRRYRDNLKKIVLYGESVFGTGVAEDFLNEAHSLVARLQQMPHIHPKSRFIDSTPDKTYRNIYFRSHTIVYVVTPTKIRVLDILHQHTNPKVIAKTKL